MRSIGWSAFVVVFLVVGGLSCTREKKPSPEVKWEFAYDDAGRITKVGDPAGNVIKVNYQFDDEGRIRRVTRELPKGSSVSLEFDHQGHRTQMTDSGGVIRYIRDGFGRLTTVQRDGVPTITYTYDTMDRVNSIDLGGGLTTKYTYDFLGRLVQMDTPAGAISYEYQTNSRTTTLPNGIRTVRESGPDGRVKSITHLAQDGTVLAHFTYGYQADGLISTLSEHFPQEENLLLYKYDNRQRLSTVKDSRKNGEFNYTWDQMGNLIASVAPGQPRIESLFDWAGRMVGHAGQASTHDASGNITAYTPEQEKVFFTYTTEHCIATVQTNHAKVGYQWDGDGNLIARSIGSSSTTFVPDPKSETWRPLLAIEADGKRALYVWEGTVPLAAVADGELRFFLSDHQSVRLIANGKGTVVQRYDYTPLGGLPLSPMQEAGGDGLRPAFGGLFFDPRASLYLSRSGAYDPRLGRLLQNGLQIYTVLFHSFETGNGGLPIQELLH